MRRRVPSFFSLDPKGEQCKLGQGGWRKGPEVCLRLSSLFMASVTAPGYIVADKRFFGCEAECGAL